MSYSNFNRWGTSRKVTSGGLCDECTESADCVEDRPEGTTLSTCKKGCCIYARPTLDEDKRSTWTPGASLAAVQRKSESYSNFNIPGYGKKQPSVMGNFYKGKYDFVNDNRPKSQLQHSYGLGKGFGFSGFAGEETITVQEFIDEVP